MAQSQLGTRIHLQSEESVSRGGLDGDVVVGRNITGDAIIQMESGESDDPESKRSFILGLEPTEKHGLIEVRRTGEIVAGQYLNPVESIGVYSGAAVNVQELSLHRTDVVYGQHHFEVNTPEARLKGYFGQHPGVVLDVGERLDSETASRSNGKFTKASGFRVTSSSAGKNTLASASVTRSSTDPGLHVGTATHPDAAFVTTRAGEEVVRIKGGGQDPIAVTTGEDRVTIIDQPNGVVTTKEPSEFGEPFASVVTATTDENGVWTWEPSEK